MKYGTFACVFFAASFAFRIRDDSEMVARAPRSWRPIAMLSPVVYEVSWGGKSALPRRPPALPSERTIAPVIARLEYVRVLIACWRKC